GRAPRLACGRSTPSRTTRASRSFRAAECGWTVASGRHLLARLRDHRAQLLAGLEHRDGARRDFHGVAGARIAGHAGLALPDLDRPKPAYLNVMLLRKRSFHGVEK